MYFRQIWEMGSQCAAEGFVTNWSVRRILTYLVTLYDKSYHLDVELVENMLSKMKRGKAAGLDGLTVEHLTHRHPIILSIIVKLFYPFN